MSSRRIAVVVAVAAAAAIIMVAEASATSDADALRYPGRPGGSRPRSSFLPGFRPSPPATSGGTTRPSPAPVVPSAPAFQQPAACPKPPSSSSAFLPVVPGIGGGGPSSSSPTECVTPLARLMTCGAFLTGSEAETPAPQSECCTGLQGFLNSTSSSAADSGAEESRTLRCLCPLILGDVNKVLPRPIDPVRLMYLPIACGVVLPPQVLYICFTGQQTPPLVGRIPDVWEKPSAALSP